MAERPLILFPTPEDSERAKGGSGQSPFSKPSVGRQFERLEPRLEQLQKAIELKNITVQQSPTGINPEFALVFEVINSVDSFYTAVKRIDGFEWMFDFSIEGIPADDDFYQLDKHGQAKDGDLTGKVYCVMSNKQAIDQLVSLWQRYKKDENMKFDTGYTGFRDVFRQLKDIRPWSAKDRIEETHIIEYWKEYLEFNGDDYVNFEIELFFRKNLTQRAIASNTIKQAIESLDGRVYDECIIDGIYYHCILASLPRKYIQVLVNNYEDVELTKVDDIMFFRPVGQIIYRSEEETFNLDQSLVQVNPSIEEPIVAIFDGYPMQNHKLLENRLVIDDPDNWSSLYLVKDRVHGTAMASLVLYGDLSKNENVIKNKIYIRPIFKPHKGFNDSVYESVPDDIILVDLIHRAVRRLFENDGDSAPVAPFVKVINLSMGDPYRQFVNMMSPLARLLDWLSYKYKVLFVISAGNHNCSGLNIDVPFDNFRQLKHDEREKLVLKMVERQSRNMRLLSPAESINNITVGALFTDRAEAKENERLIFPYAKSLPSPISAVGLGFNRSIKPDIFYDGGRKYITGIYSDTLMRWVGAENPSTHAPGCCVAVPGITETASNVAYTFGTSDSTAQISHEAVKCHAVLDSIFRTQTGESIPNDYAAILIKAMLVHGASWNEESVTSIVSALNLEGKDANRLYRWLGNGVPDITRVEECAKNRVTLIGFGSLDKDKAHVYRLPLPFDFSSQRFFRRLVVTLSYFTPIEPTRQKYRSAQLWFSLENHNLVPTRVNTDDKAVRRGTLQHEIFYGEKASFWDSEDVIKIKINCKENAGKISAAVPYGVFVTFEAAKEIDIDIYTDVVTKVRELVTVTP